MEDGKPLNPDVLLAAEATRNAEPADPTTGEASKQPEVPKLTKRQRKQMKEQQAKFAKMFQGYEERRAKAEKKLKEESLRMKDLIGRTDYNVLKDICTIHTPEQKDEKGEVTAEASSFVNHKALIEEAKLLLVLKREERIKLGTRKRSTGRSSDRKAHGGLVNFINQRNDDTLKKEPLKNQSHS